MTDERLLNRASRGDEAAFLLLYERHRDAVFRFAYRLLGSTGLAEDITHDCFLSLLRQPLKFDPARASLRTYLLSAVRNLSSKHFRQATSDMTLEDLKEELQMPAGTEPLRQLLDEELSGEVQRAVESLPPLQREAIVLFEYEELSLAEIALIVGADVGAVKARLHRARQRLKKVLAPYMSNDRHSIVVEEALNER